MVTSCDLLFVPYSSRFHVQACSLWGTRASLIQSLILTQLAELVLCQSVFHSSMLDGHALNHAQTTSFAYSFLCSLKPWLIHLLNHARIYAFAYSFLCLVTHLLIHSRAHSFVQSFTNLLLCLFILSFIRLLSQSLTL